MAGRVIQLLPRTLYRFSDLKVSGDSHVVRFLQRLDVSGFTEATIVARLHPGSVVTGTNTLVAVGAIGEGHTWDDPATSFDTTNAPIAAALFGATDVAPTVRLSTVVVGSAFAPAGLGHFGSMLTFFLIFEQDTVAAGTIEPILSADLVLKAPSHNTGAET